MRTNKFKLMGLLLCFMAASAMVSCTDDNNENGTVSASIVGTWGCVHSYLHYWGTDYQGNDYDEERTDSYKGNVVNFKDDGSYTASKSWSMHFDDDGGTWMIDGNSLIVDREACDIQTLNSTTLKLHWYEPAVEGYETEHEEWTLEFKRQ